MHLSYSGPPEQSVRQRGKVQANFPPPSPSPVHLPRRMLWVIRIINTLSRSLQSPAVISNLSLGISFSYQTLPSCLQGVPDLPCVHAPSRLPTGHTSDPRAQTHTLPEVMNRYIYTLTAYTCTLLTWFTPRKLMKQWQEEQHDDGREKKSFLALDFSRVLYKWNRFLSN